MRIIKINPNEQRLEPGDRAVRPKITKVPKPRKSTYLYNMGYINIELSNESIMLRRLKQERPEVYAALVSKKAKKERDTRRVHDRKPVKKLDDIKHSFFGIGDK